MENNKMGRVGLNNEIVLLRQSVRQARICVINKLVREVKKLRTSHGDEKLLKKYTNKAEKLLREVSALKRVKNDGILKFGIMRFDNLQNILQSAQTDDGTRVMAKVVRYKSLNARILEFREKHPDYSEQISWTKEKMLLPEKKGNNVINLKNGRLKLFQIDTNSAKENFHKKGKNVPHNTSPIPYLAYKKNEEETREDHVLVDTISNAELQVKGGEELRIKTKVADVKKQTQNSQRSKAITKAINCQVTVKKFTEFLQEMELTAQNMLREEAKNDQPANRRSESIKEASDFFLYVNDANSHLRGTQCVGGTSINRAFDVSRKSSMPFQIQAKKNKLNIERVKKERTDYRRQKMHNKETVKNGLSFRDCKQSDKSLVDVGKGAKTVQLPNNEILHPSWAAKKKQQDIMKQRFQGKKIKFDVD